MKMSSASPPTTTFRVLLVDDNKHGLAVRKSLLEDAGYCVTACVVPEQALQQFAGSTFDLVITEYRMPNMPAGEIIQQIKQIRPAVPIIVISALVEVLGLTEKNTGANIVIAKTSTEVNHLIRAVGKLVQGHTPKKPLRSQVRARVAKSG